MAKRYGLRSTLPGAPNTPHTVPGLRGFFRPDVPTPVGEDGEMSLEAAREADKDKGTYLELVELTASKAKAAEKLAAETLDEARRGIVQARADGPVEAEVQRVKDEQAAAKE